MKYITLFETSAAYNAATLDLPNVSLIEENMSVSYNSYVEPETRVVAKYNVINTSSTTTLRTNYEQNIFKSMEIDGVMLDNLVTGYTFDTTGIHTVKYELYDETKLGNHAPVFNTSNLVECIIPNSVTSIGSNVFVSCSGLTSIDIPSSVTSIGDNAFAACSNLTSLTIPDSVTSIGGDAFGGCRGLTSLTVDSNNTVYDSRNNCNAIIATSTNILIAGCKNTVIPNSVTSIGDKAFDGCSDLTSLTIPSSVTSIGNMVFAWCSGLTSLTVDSNNTVYDSRNNCNAIINTETNTLMYGCKTTIIPNSVTSIGSSAFYQNGLTSIDIPSSVTSISDGAFLNCASLRSLTIGSDVTSIGINAFAGCNSLTSITSNATTAPTIQSTTFQNIKTGGTLTVPVGSTGYDVWMGTGDYYLGKYNWTKVEQ